MRDDGVPSANVFAQQVEEMVWMKDVSYIEAVVIWCEERGLDPEVGAGLVKKSAPIKGKIEVEGEDLRMIRGDGGRRLF